jgi:hypothetical protein
LPNLRTCHVPDSARHVRGAYRPVNHASDQAATCIKG